jgi:Mg2+-importing ATPase
VVATLLEGRDQHHELICKGAVEEVLAICTQVRTQDPTDASLDGERSMPTLGLDAALLARTQAVTAGLNAEGLRVVAVAVKTMPPGQTVYSVADESGLTLIGYIAFLDPPKESAAPALKKLAEHGITVKVLTGDNDLVTAQVCRQVGLPLLPGGSVLLGAQVEGLSDVALKAAAQQHHIFAKLAPLHKERIVRALRASGHVVGFMGDGINDAPALRAADIGISVDSAVDIAKEAADIILLEKSLLVLGEGVVEGRTTFCNMLKYIRMTASSNFGNVLSVLVASAFLPFLPMLPLQLLVQNLLYDIGQTGIPFDNVDPELVTKPLKWNPGDIGRFMLFFGPISSLFDIITFAVMWWVFDANNLARQGLFQSGWFVVGLLTQTLVVHMVRTPKLPFVQSHAAAPLMAMTLAIMAIGLWLPLGPLAGYFKLQALPLAYYGWLFAILLGYCVLTTVMKRFYIRRYGWQ